MDKKLEVIFNEPTEQAAQQHFESFLKSIRSLFDDILNWNIGEEEDNFFPWEVAAQKFFDDKSFNDKQGQSYKLIDNSILYAVKNCLIKV